jgi:hypothetical protein
MRKGDRLRNTEYHIASVKGKKPIKDDEREGQENSTEQYKMRDQRLHNKGRI